MPVRRLAGRLALLSLLLPAATRSPLAGDEKPRAPGVVLQELIYDRAPFRSCHASTKLVRPASSRTAPASKLAAHVAIVALARATELFA